jgi:site-specific recombinase XerD
MKPKSAASSFAALVQGFFCQHLIQQRNASAQTVASYRDTFRLLLGYLQKVRKKLPSAVKLADLDAPVVSAFLDHLEKKRHNSIRTRNTRFAAIRSFLKYAAALDPASLPIIQRVLAMPMKRFSRRLLGYMSRDEVMAILDAPNASTWSGQRDRVLFALLYNTGARVSEALALRRSDVSLGPSRNVQITGKGRKQRMIPLWSDTAKRLREWMARISQDPQACLFPNRNGQPLSRSGAEKRLRRAVKAAASQCPTLRSKRVSPHTFRHTTAMHLLQSEGNIATVAMWLGHEGIGTTHQYVEANMAMKEDALSKLAEIPTKALRFRVSDKLLQFLENL